MKIFPLLHIQGFIKAMNLWILILQTQMQSFWYIFFNRLWINNEDLIINNKVDVFFDPNQSTSICYYIMNRIVIFLY